MSKRKLVIACLILTCFFSGCGGARFGLGRGGGKITVPFDPPYDRRVAEEQPVYGSTKDLPI
jgi:hypothetical protein